MGFLIRASCLWDGDAGWGARPVAVRVDGDRIARIERECAPLAADAVEVLDFGEATILPGLFDLHTHLGINHQTGDIKAQMRDPAVRHVLAGVQGLRADLESGVTTAKLNGDREFFDVQVRDAIRDGVAARAAARRIRAGHQVLPLHGRRGGDLHRG